MNRKYSPMDEINLIAQIADLKEVNYKNTLVITALIELLVEKGVLSRSEVIDKASDLEFDLTLDIMQQKPFPTSRDLN